MSFDVRYHELLTDATCTLCGKQSKEVWRLEFMDGSIAGAFDPKCEARLRRMKAKVSSPVRPQIAPRTDGATAAKGGLS